MVHFHRLAHFHLSNEWHCQAGQRGIELPALQADPLDQIHGLLWHGAFPGCLPSVRLRKCFIIGVILLYGSISCAGYAFRLRQQSPAGQASAMPVQQLGRRSKHPAMEVASSCQQDMVPRSNLVTVTALSKRVGRVTAWVWDKRLGIAASRLRSFIGIPRCAQWIDHSEHPRAMKLQ